jgi:hypothetical protein
MALQNTKNDSETVHEMETVKDPDSSHLKLDVHGLPLVPQPSDHKDDPLVCTLPQPLECSLPANYDCRIGSRYINTMYSSYYVCLRSLCSVRA